LNTCATVLLLTLIHILVVMWLCLMLQTFSKEAERKWHTHTGEGLGLMAWGLAQYGYSPCSWVAKRVPAQLDDGSSSDAGAATDGSDSWSEEEGDEEQYEEHRSTSVQQTLGASATLLPRLRMSSKERAWWARYFNECGDKWDSASPKALVLMLFGVAELIGTAPDR
jgi:hypothetical protein